MAGELVLITGGTGHLGFRTLVLALEAGYRVRAAVRSETKARKILDTLSIKRINPGSNLTFTTVPDLTVSGAYDDAVKDVKYILHIASPLAAGKATPSDKYQEVYFTPAINDTIGMLESAKKTGANVQRIVITSSIIAQIPFGGDTESFDADSRTPSPDPSSAFSSDFEAYAGSKVAALNEAEAWMPKKEKENLKFDLIHIHPSFIFGADELVTTVQKL